MRCNRSGDTANGGEFSWVELGLTLVSEFVLVFFVLTAVEGFVRFLLTFVVFPSTVPLEVFRSRLSNDGGRYRDSSFRFTCLA